MLPTFSDRCWMVGRIGGLIGSVVGITQALHRGRVVDWPTTVAIALMGIVVMGMIGAWLGAMCGAAISLMDQICNALWPREPKTGKQNPD